MALLFSFQSSNESVFPAALRARLRKPLYDLLGPRDGKGAARLRRFIETG
jgi:hypothetical protein